MQVSWYLSSFLAFFSHQYLIYKHFVEYGEEITNYNYLDCVKAFQRVMKEQQHTGDLKCLLPPFLSYGGRAWRGLKKKKQSTTKTKTKVSRDTNINLEKNPFISILLRNHLLNLTYQPLEIYYSFVFITFSGTIPWRSHLR